MTEGKSKNSGIAVYPDDRKILEQVGKLQGIRSLSATFRHLLYTHPLVQSIAPNASNRTTENDGSEE